MSVRVGSGHAEVSAGGREVGCDEGREVSTDDVPVKVDVDLDGFQAGEGGLHEWSQGFEEVLRGEGVVLGWVVGS